MSLFAAIIVGTGLLAFGLIVRRGALEWRRSQLIYDLEDTEIAARLTMASRAGQALASASTIWHVDYSIRTTDLKRNAGAGTLIRRTRTRVAPGTLAGIEFNIEPWAVPVGPQQLLLLPDRLLVWDGHALAGVPYDHLAAEASTQRVIEDDLVPPDTRIVDTRWRYVNKNGGPDRRFASNRRLAVVEYGELLLSTSSGLRVLLQTSTPAAAADAAAHLSMLHERASAPAESVGVHDCVPAPATQSFYLDADVDVDVDVGVDVDVDVDVSTPIQQLRTAAIEPVMVVLRNLAGADRRIDEKEIELAFDVHQQLRGPHDDPAAFAQWFRGLPANAAAVAAAVRDLSNASPDDRRWVLEQFDRLTRADGKQTQKEFERLTELRTALGQNPRMQP
ncbi:hypothetical protein ACNOYE_29810 [Nannocystaceae bacterium ST9]